MSEVVAHYPIIHIAGRNRKLTKSSSLFEQIDQRQVLFLAYEIRIMIFSRIRLNYNTIVPVALWWMVSVRWVLYSTYSSVVDGVSAVCPL